MTIPSLTTGQPNSKSSSSRNVSNQYREKLRTQGDVNRDTPSAEYLNNGLYQNNNTETLMDSHNASHMQAEDKQGRPGMAEVEALLKFHQVNRMQTRSDDTATPHVSSTEGIDQFSPTEISKLYDNACGQTLYENSVSKPIDSIMSSNRMPANSTQRSKGVKS